LRRRAAQAGSLFRCSTVLNVGRAALLFAALMVLIFSATPALADVLVQGGGVFASAVGDPVAGSSVAAAPFTVMVPSDSWTANLTSAVYYNSPNNPYSSNYDTVAATSGPQLESVGNAMTFVYQIQLTSDGGDIAQMNVGSFADYNTNVGYYDPTETEVDPDIITRDPQTLDNNIYFQFFPFLLPGAGNDLSATLVINTDATTFTTTTAVLQDATNGYGYSFAILAPMYATPEPSSIVLMVLGLTGLFAVGRARRSDRFGRRIGL
jgi:hypothetical protein